MRAYARLLSLSLLSALTLALPAAAQAPSFVAFESGPVRPLALSPNGNRLAVVNTPDNRLEIFTVVADGLRSASSVKVGLEPVAVAWRNDGELWVVNHLSDSVSIVDVTASPEVTRTLLVGDEPRDIVFAGPGGDRAFITTAHRGQHRVHASINGVTGAGDPQLTTQSIPRADVWVFDATALGGTIGGTPLKIVELFGDTPRALAVSSNGNTVYAAVFHSGNQTAVVSEGVVCDNYVVTPCNTEDQIDSPNGLPGGQVPGGNPGPTQTLGGVAAPEVGLVVKYDNASGEWRDETSRNWSNGIRFNLPDHDVFAIDATTLNQTDDYEHVGTILFNMAVNPANGNVYVSNTDSNNLVRFEGPGGGGSTVQGKLSLSHISIIEPGTGTVRPRHLNRHLTYALPEPAGKKQHTLATPLGMAVSSDGATLYVAAFGSSKIGVFATADLENDALFDGNGAEFDPEVESANYIPVSGGGASAVVLDEGRNRLYVTTRFNNGVSIVDLGTGTEQANIPLHNPEPGDLVAGRFMLYDADRSSSNGEASCSSCHVFGDFDSLAWDLGDPDGGVGQNPNTINLNIAAGDQNGGAANDEFHPMKGPMTTQTLRGMATSGHMHWRGDRADGFFGLDGDNNGDGDVDDPGDVPNNNDEDLSFRNFIVAFPGLLGLDVDLDDVQDPKRQPLIDDIQKFADFQLQVLLPPNPVRGLDNSLSAQASLGRSFYLGQGPGNVCSDGICFGGNPNTGIGFTCEGCHELDASQGFFGTGGTHSFENELQIFKIPHLRNMYQKVGMFGMPEVQFNNAGDNGHKGDQVRGTGFLHDGSTDTIFRFFQATVFNDAGGFANAGFSGANGGDDQRRETEAFMLEFDSDLAPIVGQQVTVDSTNQGDPDVTGRVGLMETRSTTAFTSAVLGGGVTECDLVARATVGGVERGYLHTGGGSYLSDAAGDPVVSQNDLFTLAATPGQEVTFTCVPPGSGERVARDRDADGVLDFDEVAALTDPANPASFPGACNNGLDDDGDGQVDLADGGCRNDAWDVENPACDNGIDDDGDGTIDLADGNCGQAWGKREFKTGCGLLGIEALVALAPLGWRRRRAHRANAS